MSWRGNIGALQIHRKPWLGALAMALAGLAAWVSIGSVPTLAVGAPRPTAVLRVFAAASLSDAFEEIAKGFEKDHPGLDVQLNLAGSQVLATQIEQGAGADLFASADQRWVDYLVELRLLEGEPSVFAHNRLAVIVPRPNPARIRRLQDLARRGVKLVVASDAVPVGHYTREMLGNLARAPGFDKDFDQRVLMNIASEEENVKSVLGKVQLGEADAGVVYRSDITPSIARYVRSFPIPDSLNVLADYPIALVKGSRQPELAREFVNRVRSEAGQKVLQVNGLIPIASAP